MTQSHREKPNTCDPITHLLPALRPHQCPSFSKSTVNPLTTASRHEVHPSRCSLTILLLSKLLENSSLAALSLSPPNRSTSGLPICIFPTFPGVSDTVGSFHVESLFPQILRVTCSSFRSPGPSAPRLSLPHSFPVCSERSVSPECPQPSSPFSVSSFSHFSHFPDSRCHSHTDHSEVQCLS